MASTTTNRNDKICTVYKCLRHHYVLKRSVVFIVDNIFSDTIFQKMSANYVKTFFNLLSPNDHFGYISLGKRAEEIILERKEKSTFTKKQFLKEINKTEIYEKPDKSHEVRLEIALQKALYWQSNRVEDTKVEVNGHVYYRPHKRIVCIIGSDIFPVGNFLNEYKSHLKSQENLSISMMGLSCEPFGAWGAWKHLDDYRKLC